MAMLSMAGIIVAIDSFGPITDNAGGIAEMAEMPEEVRDVTDPLDAVGNTTKAVTKGYAIGSAALAAVVLFASFIQELSDKCKLDTAAVCTTRRDFRRSATPSCSPASSSAACCRISSRRSRWKRSAARPARSSRKSAGSSARIPGIMAGTAKPDYGTTVDIVTKAALKEMIVPALIPVGVAVSSSCSR